MQDQLSRAVFIDRETNEIKEARSFALSRVEGFWGSCLWRLLGGADIRERMIWETKVCPSLFLCYYTQESQPFLWFPLSPVSEWPPHLYPLTYASDLCIQIPIWHLHLNITQEHPTQSVQRWTHHSSDITFAFAFYFQVNDSTIHLSHPRKYLLFVHSLIWKKIFIFLHTLYQAMFACCQYRS